MSRRVRRVLVRVIRRFIARPAALVGAATVLVLVIAATVLLPVFVLGGNSPTSHGAASDATAAETFLRGNKEFRAELVWNSFSEEVRQRMSSQGSSLETLEQQMQVARQRGVRLEEISYIGGKDLPNGTSMQFYLVGVRQPSRGDLEYVPYTFTLDRGGKIAKVQ